MGCYLMQEAVNSKSTQLNGITLINDLRGLSYNTMYQLTSISDAKRGVKMFQEAFPCKLRRIFVISPGPWYKYLIDSVKMFVSQKIQDRIIVLDPEDLSLLYEEVPKEQLPLEFGGQLDMCPIWDDFCAAAVAREEQWQVARGIDIDSVESDGGPASCPGG